MTTASWSDILRHDSDATFRAWGSDYSAHLAAIGMVKTADTGQIDWATAIYAQGSSLHIGYEIWKFADTLQASSPIFVKLWYGSSSAATNKSFPAMFITVGTGSDGSGGLTGPVTNEIQLSPSNNSNWYVSTITVAMPSYFCHTEGFLGTAFRVGAWQSSSTGCSFAICRYCNSDGTPNGNGFVVYGAARNVNGVGQYTCQVQSVRTASPETIFGYDTSGMYCMITHGQDTSVLPNSDFQVYTHWAPTKMSAPLNQLCTHIASELSQGTTFETTLLGSTPHTYISTGKGLGLGGATGGNIAMLWE